MTREVEGHFRGDFQLFNAVGTIKLREKQYERTNYDGRASRKHNRPTDPGKACFGLERNDLSPDGRRLRL
jgi:hypothetical protein